MKKTILLLATIFITLVAACQGKDHTFDVLIKFNQGIQFGDGTIQLTAGGGTVSSLPWSAITAHPTTLAGYGITDAASVLHTHSLLYKPIDYRPTWNDVLDRPTFAAVATTGSYNDLADKPEMIELEEALPTLQGIKLPVLTQAQINALTPVKGLLLFNDTDGVLQIYNGVEWKVIVTTN